MDELFILTKWEWTDHVHNLELMLIKLKEKDLNVILKSHSPEKPKYSI